MSSKLFISTFLSNITTIPIPQLYVSIISSTVISEFLKIHLNISGISHLPSICILCSLSNILGIFSTKPPPVI